MNYQENEQVEGGQGSAQQNQNPTGQPLSGDAGGTLNEDSGQREDWSDEETTVEEEDNIGSGVLEEEGDGSDEETVDDELTETYDQEESGAGLDEDDREERDQTMI